MVTQDKAFEDDFAELEEDSLESSDEYDSVDNDDWTGY